jgi:hypothetical protein
MKAVVLALLLALQAPSPGGGIALQTVVPNISGFSIQGSTVSLSSFKGKRPVLVVFYRTEA